MKIDGELGALLERLFSNKREVVKTIPLTPEALASAKRRRDRKKPLHAELDLLLAKAKSIKAQLEAIDAEQIHELETLMPEIESYDWKTDVDKGTVELYATEGAPSGEPSPATAADAEVICAGGPLTAEQAQEILAGLPTTGRKAS